MTQASILNDRGHVSHRGLDRLRLEMLSAAEQETVENHLEGCEHCRGRLRELDQDYAHFDSQVRARGLERLEAATSSASFRRGFLGLRWNAVTVAATVASVLVLVLVWVLLWALGGGGIGSGDLQNIENQDVLIKGQPTFQVFAKRGSQVFKVSQNTVLREGDRIRFRINPAGAGYVLVASLDGAGNAQVYYPFDGQASAAVLNQEQELPGSVELDATPGTERLLAVFSPQALAAGRVLSALRAGKLEIEGASRVVLLAMKKANP